MRPGSARMGGSALRGACGSVFARRRSGRVSDISDQGWMKVAFEEATLTAWTALERAFLAEMPQLLCQRAAIWTRFSTSSGFWTEGSPRKGFACATKPGNARSPSGVVCSQTLMSVSRVRYRGLPAYAHTCTSRLLARDKRRGGAAHPTNAGKRRPVPRTGLPGPEVEPEGRVFRRRSSCKPSKHTGPAHPTTFGLSCYMQHRRAAGQMKAIGPR